MASEIRVNKIENRSGLGTVTFADTGVDLAGIVTATTFSGSGASLTALPAANITGTLPAISAANLTNVPAANVVGVHTSLTVTNATTTGTAVVGGGVTISESGIEASGIGITCASFNGGQISGRRNIIINGDMRIAQRGTSSTTAGYETVDRIETSVNDLDETPTFAQVDVSSGTSPYTEGFRKAFKITNGNQTSGAGGADYIIFRHKIEAQNVANSGWNYTSTSSFVTLSFWVKASVAQNYYFSLLSSDGTLQNFPMETGSLTANTWTKITKTIPGAANVQFDNDNGIGIELDWWPFAGTDYTANGVALNTWAAFAAGTRFPNHTSTWYTTNDATFEITGLQLEVGSVATDFEHRSFDQELALCERYFEKSYNYSVVPGTVTDAGLLMWLANRNPGLPHTNLRYKKTKRANPTVTIFNTNTANSNTLRDKDSASNLTPQVTRLGEKGCTIHTNTSVALGNFIAYHYTADSEL